MPQLQAAKQELEVERNLKQVMENAKETLENELEYHKKKTEEHREFQDNQEARMQASVDTLNQELEKLKKKVKKQKDKFKALKKKTKDESQENEGLKNTHFPIFWFFWLDLKDQVSANEKKIHALQKELEHRDAALAKAAEEKTEGENAAALYRTKVQDLESVIQNMRREGEKLKANYVQEQQLRKKYYNQLEDMKGSIRVFARTRPMAEAELAQNQKQVVVLGDGKLQSI